MLRARWANTGRVGLSVVVLSLVAFWGAGMATHAQGAPPVPIAYDERALADESFATQATFRAVWGDQAEARWVGEHNAALAGGTTVQGPRIGYISNGARPSANANPNLAAFFQGLRESGYEPGRNIRIEWRYTGGQTDRLTGMIADLVSLPVDLIVAQNTPEAFAARDGAPGIPIVTVSVADPAQSGLVNSLDRPAGNVTGFIGSDQDLADKRVALLKQLVPGASRIAILLNPASPAAVVNFDEHKATAERAGFVVVSAGARSADELGSAFDAAVGGRAEAMLVVQDTLLLNASRQTIVDLATSNRMPTLYSQRSGDGLASLSVLGVAPYRGMAGYIDKILKGAKPADLPMVLPSPLEVVVNVKSADAIGFTIPPSVLSQATDVIR